MERVAGTRIERAMDDDRSRSVLVSDLHIPAGESAVQAMFHRLLLDLCEHEPGRTRLVVLGDLFDAYISPKQVRAGVWRSTADALRMTATAGVSITLLHGNRDYMLEDSFAREASCRVVGGGLQLALGGDRGLLLHGDELCQRDLPYQRAKRFLRHPVTKFLLRRLPLSTALRLAERARRKSAKVIAGGDQTRFDPVASAVGEALSESDLLVFGHIHRPARGRFAGGEYAILPAFDDAGIHLRHRAGRLFYCDVEGRELPDYPARAFQ